MYTAKTLTGERSIVFKKEGEVSQNENWNLLYVAMTRSKQGLWISGVAAKSKSGIKERSWYGRALAAGIPTLDIDALNLPSVAIDTKEIEVERGSMPFKIDHFQVEWGSAITTHQEHLAKIESGALAQELRAKALEQAKEEPDPETLEEGTNFHKLLEFITPDSANQNKPAMPSEQELMNWLGVDQGGANKLIAHVQKVLTTPELKHYLTSGEWVQAWNELDIASEQGKSYRMDRLVEFDEHLAIIDYKLTIPEVGSEKYEKYRKQLQGYQAELTRIRKDKTNKAYLISSKGEMVEVK
jgi:ATP-dependent helicase/nuclease subunit A